MGQSRIARRRRPRRPLASCAGRRPFRRRGVVSKGIAGLGPGCGGWRAGRV